MKKITFLCIAFACMLLHTSCSHNGSPREVANKFIEYYKDKNFDGIRSMIEFHNEDSSLVDNEKIENFMQNFEKKAERIEQREGKITNMEITAEEIDQNTNSGEVIIKITFEKGNVDEDRIPVKKNDKGDWKIFVNIF